MKSITKHRIKLISYITFWVAFWSAIVAGWILNVMAIFGSDFSHVTGQLAVRIIGVFIAPIGVFMGLAF